MALIVATSLSLFGTGLDDKQRATSCEDRAGEDVDSKQRAAST